MAGKSPWGGNPGDGENNEGSGDQPPSDKPKGPKNPWLPPSSGDDRRSANIEDIFKNRGPEGPRRGGPGGPNFRLPKRPGGKSWFPVFVVGLVSLGLLTTMVHQVEAGEEGVVKTLGSYSRTLQPGIKVTMPWPLETVQIENVQNVRQLTFPADGEEKLILTGDQNLVNLSYIIRFNIKDLSNFKFQLAEPIETVREVAEAAMRASVAEKTLDETFSGQGRAEIEERVRTRMQAILDAYRAGIQVQGVEIDKTDPPTRVVEAFKDVSAAEQDADAARNRARAYAQRVLNLASGEAEAFDRVYQEYRLAPEVTRQRLYYETMERILSQTDKTIVEADGVTPYLPLPEIQRRARSSSATPAAPAEGQ
ncbi:protease modulator HflK [Erythrobacter sp. HKB08]|uniref:protease modulator HflK n=1 Tax=Erythrobacter sp. HKB08 TaxID=2502843 RepID=UPI001008B900|nr:protease modulator HflK [Erythrobacter sp. HKB08]